MNKVVVSVVLSLFAAVFSTSVKAEDCQRNTPVRDTVECIYCEINETADEIYWKVQLKKKQMEEARKVKQQMRRKCRCCKCYVCCCDEPVQPAKPSVPAPAPTPAPTQKAEEVKPASNSVLMQDVTIYTGQWDQYNNIR